MPLIQKKDSMGLIKILTLSEVLSTAIKLQINTNIGCSAFLFKFIINIKMELYKVWSILKIKNKDIIITTTLF